jgi:hypothetical protein
MRIKFLQKKHKVIREITQFSASPYDLINTLATICEGTDGGEKKGIPQVGVVSEITLQGCYIRWADGSASGLYKHMTALIQAHPNTKFYHI